jgi:integrase
LPIIRRTRLVDHLEGFIRSLKAAGRSDRHINDTNRLARQIAADCGFRVLRDIEADEVESWLVEKLDVGMAARTRNSYLGALNGFCAWCVRNRRLTTNPIRNIAKADEQSDRRLVRRAMTEAELLRLLYVARLRPLAECGRETIRKPACEVTGKRDTWKPAPLTFETIEAAAERARERLADKPERIAELEAKGRERALVLKTLLLTGLRSGELRSITVGQVHLDDAMPYIELRSIRQQGC